MGSTISTILAILQLVPAIIAAVKGVEEAIPMPNQGKAKLDMVMNIVQAAGDGSSQLLPVIQKAIGIVVSTMNSIGLFKSGNANTAA